MLNVFISHSSKTSERIDFVKSLRQKLGEEIQNVNVFLDVTDIESSEQWHDKILSKLCCCDVHIIVLSNQAIESGWVKQEAAFSAIRRFGDPGLKILVLPAFDDVTDEQIKACNYLGKVAKLHDIQFATRCENADVIAQQVSAATSLINSPIGELLLKMSETLSSVHENAIKRGLSSLQDNKVSSLPWQSKACYQLALRVASEQEQALSNFMIVMNEISNAIGQESARKLLFMVANLWIKPESASILTGCLLNGSAAVLNCYDPEEFTSRSIADRAWGRGHHKIINVGGCSSFGEIEGLLLENIGSPNMKERFRRRKLARNKKPIVLVFPAPECSEQDFESFPDASLIQDVIEQFPNVTAFVASGNEVLEYREDLVVLEKDFDVANEESQYFEFIDAKEFIDNSM